MRFETVLSPCKIGNLQIKNRFVVPPMGTNYGTYEGMVTDQLIDYYAARAKGGFGLIYTEVTAVAPNGKAILNELGLWSDEQMAGMKKLVDAVHANGAKIFCQLHHAGRQTAPPYIFNELPVGASHVPCPVVNCPVVELTGQQVWDMVENFVEAAKRAKACGFDGVEVHGGHGYLVAQFMSMHSNKRYDEWGGDFEGRMKFPREIFRGIKKACGKNYPMSFRFSYDEKVPGGRTLEESCAVARMAEEEGVDVLNVTIMTYASTPYMSAAAAMPAGFNEFPTEVIKKAVQIPVIGVGRYNNMYVVEDMLLSGRADFVAMGRESLADPELPNKVAEGRLEDISPCIACTQSCIGYVNTARPISCLVRPMTGHEHEYDLSPVPEEQKKKVLVVGAGPAGLQAAMISAMRGHDVTVWEKSAYIGGQFRLAAIPPTKSEILMALKYFLHTAKKHGAKFMMNTEATKERILEGRYDSVILATGGIPAKPSIKGIDGEKVVTAADILSGKAAYGDNILIVGGGVTGAETADYLGEHNKHVTILEMRDDIALDEEIGPRFWLMQRIAQHGIQKVCNAVVDQFLDDGVVYNGGQELRGFDTIVLAMGVKPYNPLEAELKDLDIPVQVIGDARNPGKANTATEAALAAAMSI